MPYGFPATKIEWVALSTTEGESDPIPGTTISLTDYTDSAAGGRIFVMKGITGFDAPPVEIFYDEASGLDGALFRHSRVTAREIFIPIAFYANTRPGFLALKRDLLAKLARGLGRIRVTEGDNTIRYIDCFYTGGAEGSYSEDEGGFIWQKYGLTFRAMDPYWYDETPVGISWTSESADLKPFFGAPGEAFLGLRLNPNRAINGTTPITSVGDSQTWPTWSITGPVDGLTVAVSGASAGSFTLDIALASGEVVYVDTRPSRRRIIKLTTPPILVGTNLWRALQPGDSFWPLSSGINDINISAGSVGPGTAISMSYRPRYYSA